MKINRKYRLPYLLAWLLMLPSLTLAAAPADGIDDEAGLFTPAQRDSLTATLAEIERDAGFPVFIVTLKQAGNNSLQEWAERLRRDWGLADRPALIMILIAANERRARIDTYGAARHIVSDDQADRILQTQLLPAFADKDYYGGISDGLSALAGVIGNDSPRGYSTAIPFLILAGFVLLYIAQRRRHRRRRAERIARPATMTAAGSEQRENAEADPREREERDGSGGGSGGASGSW